MPYPFSDHQIAESVINVRISKKLTWPATHELRPKIRRALQRCHNSVLIVKFHAIRS
jgi:hypothetical protein